MSAIASRYDLAKTTGIFGLGLLGGGITVLLTEIPATAVAAVMFLVIAVAQYLDD